MRAEFPSAAPIGGSRAAVTISDRHAVRLAICRERSERRLCLYQQPCRWTYAPRTERPVLARVVGGLLPHRGMTGCPRPALTMHKYTASPPAFSAGQDCQQCGELWITARVAYFLGCAISAVAQIFAAPPRSWGTLAAPCCSASARWAPPWSRRSCRRWPPRGHRRGPRRLAQPERGPSRQAAVFLSQHGIARVAGECSNTPSITQVR
jgi:hypothetical protein